MTAGVAYKVLRPDEWASFIGTHYSGTAADLADGFIHLSTVEQLESTLERHYSDCREVVVLTVDLGAINGLRWEPSRGGALFPHLYAPLPRGAVMSAEQRSIPFTQAPVG